MLKSATQLWGVQTSDIAAFDPIVNLLLEACSVELEKVYNEIYSSNARVLERLSKLLLPDVNKNTLPAHGILHAGPYEENVSVNKYTQFFYSKRVQAKESSVRENTKEIYFTPAVEFPLVNGRITYRGTNTGLYSINNLIYSEKEVRCSSNKVATKFLWLGIKMNKPPKDSDSFILYFDWINNPLRDKYLDYLPFTKWYFNSVEVKYEKGIYTGTSEDKAENKVNYDNEFVQTQQTIAHYHKRFFSIKVPGITKTSEATLEKYPKEFLSIYDQAELQALNDELLWIKIVFPPFVSDDVIDSMICQVNCFPVINRKLNEVTFRLHDSDTFNIIPLKDKNDDASFFSMESVKSSDGLPYSSTNISDLNQLNGGNYVIRKGGVQRFDQRNAQEYLSYMIDLLRDESAAFSVYGQEMLSSNLKTLSQTLAIVEQKIQRSNESHHSIDYLILRSYQKQDNVHIEYWSTAGDFANNIRVGSELNLYSGNDISSDEIMLISESVGGRDELTASEMLSTFKKSLGSRERIVTIADIRNMCFSELGGLIKDVKVTKEFVVDSKTKTGFKRVIKIVLTSIGYTTTEEDWMMHKKRLETLIDNSSFSNTPIEITIVQ
jgi:hypothetical protein